MEFPSKDQWKATASGGDPRHAIDDSYTTAWSADPSIKPWIEIDLGSVANVGGLEIYWGKWAAEKYTVESSTDGRGWTLLCRTRHGEGGQDVFAFPPASARFVRLMCEAALDSRGLEIFEINLYPPDQAAKVREDGRIAALGRGPIKIPASESITVDFGYLRSPLGVLIEWGETHGTVFSVELSDDGASFREVGRIETGDGGIDNFWWRSTSARFLRLTVREANSADGAVVNELKLRILNKDRMPIGRLERAALAGRGALYPQSLLGRQVYWTALGEFDQAEQALFDEYGALEPRAGGPQLTPLIRLDDGLHGAPESAVVDHSLVEGSLPIPSVVWSARDIEIRVTALAHARQALVQYKLTNRGGASEKGALVLAVRPVQINPYWQHGGHAPIGAIAVADDQLQVNDQIYAAFSREPDSEAVADFDNGDVVRLIEKSARQTARALRSGSGLLSAACEFGFSLGAGDSATLLVSAPMAEGVAPSANVAFDEIHAAVRRAWREKLGLRKISVGDREVSDALEAEIALILVNSTRFAFKPGPRNYDRTWIRDGSSQALALLWAGLVDEAKRYVIWYSQRIYETGMVPPILNVDGSVNRGYGSDIEFDAQGEFVGVAADVYRVTKDRTFLDAIFEPVVRATRFLDALCQRTDALPSLDTRFRGLLAPSISHEGYNKPSYSYWDNYFALSAWRNCEYLSGEIGNPQIAAEMKTRGEAFAENLIASIRMTAAHMEVDLVPGSADRDDIDPTATSIAFEPCRVDDVLPVELIPATYDRAAARVKAISAPGFAANYSPYDLRIINAFVSLGRFEDAYQLLAVMLDSLRPRGWRVWAEVVWSDKRTPEYIGDMPHTWIAAEFATAIRRMLVSENGKTLELFRAVPESWWKGEGITLSDLPTAFGALNLRAERRNGRIDVELNLSGEPPNLITFRYPHAKRAWANGKACSLRGDLVEAPNCSRLVVAF